MRLPSAANNTMASITLTITDTIGESVAIHSTFSPAIGRPITPAQAHALDLISRTHQQWGLPEGSRPSAAAAAAAPTATPPKGTP